MDCRKIRAGLLPQEENRLAIFPDRLIGFEFDSRPGMRTSKIADVPGPMRRPMRQTTRDMVTSEKGLRIRPPGRSCLDPP